MASIDKEGLSPLYREKHDSIDREAPGSPGMNLRLALHAPAKISVPARQRRSTVSQSHSPTKKDPRRVSVGSKPKRRSFTEDLIRHVDYCEFISDKLTLTATDAVVDRRKSIVGPPIAQVERAEATLVTGFATLAEAQLILDISSSASVVAATMLESIPTASVVAIETGTSRNNRQEHLLASWLEGFADRLTPICGSVETAVPTLKGKRFDIIYINDYLVDCSDYVQLLLKNHLLAETGSIICSGFLKPTAADGINGARALNRWVCGQDDMETVVLPLCSGISFIKYRYISRSALSEVSLRRGLSGFEDVETEDSQSPSLSPKTPAGLNSLCMSPWWDATSIFRNVEIKSPTPSKLKTNRRSSFLNIEGMEEPPMFNEDESDKKLAALRKAGVYDDKFSRLIAFCKSRSNSEGELMRSVRKSLQSRNWHRHWEKSETLHDYTPACVCSPDPLGAMLLKQIVYMVLPRRILDIGMAGGYATMAMLESSTALTTVVSVEADPYLVKLVESMLKPYPLFAERHKVHPGAPMAVLPQLKGQNFDLVFMNVDKDEYYWCALTLLKHNLLSANGVIVCNGVLFDSRTEHTICTEPPCVLHTFNKWVHEHDRLKQRLLPISRGMSIIQLTEPAQMANNRPNTNAPKPDNRAMRTVRPLAYVQGKYIISGSTVGIGRDIALSLARAGASALLLHATEDGRDEEVMAAVQHLAPNCQVEFHVADLRNSRSCMDFIKAAVEKLGTIDGLVNCAATCFPDDLCNFKVSEACAKASFLLTQSATTHMQEKSIKGCVINIVPMAESSWIGPRFESMEAILKMEPVCIRVHTISLSRPDKEAADHAGAIKAAQPFADLTTTSDLVRTVGCLLAGPPAAESNSPFKSVGLKLR